MNNSTALSREFFKTRSLFIGLPVYGQKMDFRTCQAFDVFAGMAWNVGLNFAKSYIADTDVAIARNELVAQFRMSEMQDADGKKTPLSHLLMVDDDIVFDPAVILHMMSLNYPVLAGIVPQKLLDVKRLRAAAADASIPDEDFIGRALTYNVGMKEAKDGEKLDLGLSRDGTVEVDRVGSAFLLVKREVFDTIEKQCPAEARAGFFYQAGADKLMGHADDGKRRNFFQRGLVGDVEHEQGVYVGEDFFFSDLCKINGIGIRAFALARFGHAGPFVFPGAPAVAPAVRPDASHR